MAVDFSTVKHITIPEGEVRKITDPNEILGSQRTIWEWEKSWHTLWSGTKTIKVTNGTGSGASSNFTSTSKNTGYTPRLRITFSSIACGTKDSGGSAGYYNNNNLTETKPTSVLDINPITSPGTGTNRLLGCYNVSASAYANRIYLGAVRDTTNNKINLSLVIDSASSNVHNVTMTITKIEQYY